MQEEEGKAAEGGMTVLRGVIVLRGMTVLTGMIGRKRGQHDCKRLV